MPEPDFKTSTKKVIGVIGYGRFGQLVADTLSKVGNDEWEVIVFSRRAKEIKEQALRFLPVEDIGKADVVLPCVPISQFEEIIELISSKLKTNALVIDVCSVKVFPIEMMKSKLPETVQIIGSHPIFGPDSVKKNSGLKNFPIVLVKVRCADKTYLAIKNFCEHLGLKVLEMTAEQHDKYAAYSQAYAFLIGKIGQRMGIQATPIDTMWYKLLLEEKTAIENDSEQLFFDIQSKNPFAPEMRRKFFKTVQETFNEVER